MRCHDSVEYLLEEALQLSNKERPTKAALLAYLEHSSLPKRRAELALRLLFKVSSAESFTPRQASSLYTRYPQVIREVLNKQWGSPEINKTFFKLPTTENIEEIARLRATIVAASSQFSFAGFIEELSIINPERDRRALEAYRAELSLLQKEKEAEVVDFISRFDVCQEILSKAQIGSLCLLSSLNTLPAPQSAYLKRLQIKNVSERVARGDLGVIESLSLLEGTDYEELRTPSLHLLLLQLTESLLSGQNAAELEEALNNFKILPLLSKYDEELKQALSQAYLALANAAWEKGEISKSLQNLEYSFTIFSAEVPERIELLRKITKNKALIVEPQQQKRLAKILSENHLPSSKGFVLAVFLLALFLLCTALFFALRYRKKTLSIEERTSRLSIQQRAELRELLGHFNLSGVASEKELSRAYRKLAKTMHPDTGSDLSREFALLSSRYKRARELLQLR